jgi:hypothetical protein
LYPKSWICGIFGVGFVDATEPNIVPTGGHTAREEELSLALKEATIKLQSIL